MAKSSSKSGLIGKLTTGATIGVSAFAVNAAFSYVPPADSGSMMEKVKPALPVVPIALGIFLTDNSKKGLMSDIAAGMIAAGFIQLGHSFGIGGNDQFVNGYEDIYPPGGMSPVNGSVINGFINDNAVQSATDPV